CAVLPLIVLLVPDDSEGGCRPRSSGVAPCHRPLEEEARTRLAARRCLATGLSTPRWLGVDTDSPSHCPPVRQTDAHEGCPVSSGAPRPSRTRESAGASPALPAQSAPGAPGGTGADPARGPATPPL